MEIFKVVFPQGEYKIIFGEGESSNIGFHLYACGLQSSSILIVSNPTISHFYASKIINSLKEYGFKVGLHLIPDGESFKNIQTLSEIYDSCISNSLDRQSILACLGGGVIGDIGGFAAATYMRGINFVQIPTTLLAQVDSSIGGKVAIDYQNKKNIIGAFHQPKLILTDPKLLSTLPEKEIRNGMAEIIKSAIISSLNFFEELEKTAIFFTNSIIKQAIKVKVNVVTEDPYEKGLREILNFGHTIGHAIESASNYKLSHGEAISIGIIGAFKIANKLNICSQENTKRVSNLLLKFGLPLQCREVDITKAMDYMSADKKKRQGNLRFILPINIGEVTVVDKVDSSIVIETLRELIYMEGNNA